MFTDARVIWGAIGLTAFVIGALQVIVPLVQQRNQAMLLWGAGNLVGATGATFVSLREQMPDVASIAAASALLVGGRVLFWAGFRSFNGQRVRWSLVLGPPLLVAALCTAVPMFVEQTSPRVAMTSVIYIAYTTSSIIDGIRAERHERLVWRRCIILVLASWTAVALIRIAVGTISPDRIDPTAAGTDVVTPILGLLLAVMNGFCTILLTRERLEHELIDAAHRDFQTGTFNRAGLYEHSREIVKRLSDSTPPASVLLMDLDQFKKINDRFGHLAGDRVLADFAAIAQDVVPPGTVLARFGGEEFCAVLPQAGVPEAREVAELIRQAFERHTWQAEDGPFSATVSIGVAPLRSTGEGLEGALTEADRALYAAKAVGRNSVVGGQA